MYIIIIYKKCTENFEKAKSIRDRAVVTSHPEDNEVDDEPQKRTRTSQRPICLESDADKESGNY